MDDDISLYPREWRRTANDVRDGPVVASIDEIRYAEQLRLQIREVYLRRTAPTLPWTTSVE